MTFYKGFSTTSGTKNFRLTDFALVKQDLINHFNIRKGEKLMNPDFGTIIWDILFDPFDDTTVNLIENDIKKIISYDPRIAAQNVSVIQFDQGIQIQLSLLFLQTNEINDLIFNFEQNNKNITVVSA